MIAIVATLVSAAAIASPTQDALRSPPATAVRLIILGTQGGPIPHRNRAQPSNVLIVNGTPYLIDAGNGVIQQLTKAAVPFTAINQIFITHNHDDHDADWGTLMGLAWSVGRTKPITVYGPLGTESMLQGFLQYFGPNAAIRGSEADGIARPNPRSMFRAREIRGDGLVYADGNVRVTALEDCHFHFARGTPAFGWQKSFAFRFETSEGTIVFSGDTGPCGGRLARFAKGADVLVDEVVALDAMRQELQSSRAVGYSRKEIHTLMQIMRTEHSTPEVVGLRAFSAHVGAVVLTHLVPGDPGEPDEVYSDGVRKYYSGPVYVAKDLMGLDIWKSGGEVKVHVAQ